MAMSISNTPNTIHFLRRRLLYMLMAVMTLIAVGCTEDDYSGRQDLPTGEYQVRLLVEQQAVTTRADGDVSAIKELRVYVFNASNKLVGHFYDGSLSASGQTYYVPLRLAEGGDLTFYVVANENGGGLALSEATTKDALDKMSFITASVDRTKGDLLTGVAKATITTENAQGGSTYVVQCPLKRPFSLLEVYFAKGSSTVEASVNKIDLYDYTTGGFICDSYSPYNQSRVFGTDALVMLSTLTDVQQVVSENEHGTSTADYGSAVASVPVSVNGQGLSTGWGNTWVNEVPTTTPQPRLEIAYTVGNDDKTATVYLPRMITMNTRYNVKCLIKDTGGLFVTLVPQDWTDEEIHNYELGDAGVFVITTPNLKERVENSKVYATQYSLESNASARQFTFTLKMDTPIGVRWMAHLTNSSDFEFVIDENHAAEGVGGAGEVTIWVRPTKSFDATAERATTKLYISLGTAEGVAQRFDNDMDYTQDGQTINIEQVSQQEGDVIWNSSVQP